MLKGFMTKDGIGQCKEAAAMLRSSGFGKSGRELEALDAERIRGLVERSSKPAEAIEECRRRVGRLQGYCDLLAAVKDGLPEAYPHLIEAMSHGGYLPGEVFPEDRTVPACVIVLDPERTLTLIRSAQDGTLERLMMTMRESGKVSLDDEVLIKLAELFPSLCRKGSAEIGYLPSYLDCGWESEVFNRTEDIRRRIADCHPSLLTGSERQWLSWRGLNDAKVSGFSDVKYAEVWPKVHGLPAGPFLYLFTIIPGDGLDEIVREYGDRRIAVFRFRLPRMDNNYPCSTEAVLLHSAEEHARWQEREPMFASENVSHGIGAVLTNWGRMEKKAYLQGKYVEPANAGFRLAFGGKYC